MGRRRLGQAKGGGNLGPVNAEPDVKFDGQASNGSGRRSAKGFSEAEACGGRKTPRCRGICSGSSGERTWQREGQGRNKDTEQTQAGKRYVLRMR